MNKVNVSYYVWKGGGKRKSPGPKFGIQTKMPTDFQPDGGSSSFLVPAILQGLPLAFVSVSGSANGHYVIGNYPNPSYTPIPADPPPAFDNPPPPADMPVTVNVGQTDVNVTVWYLPIGGSGQEGAFIDSFNVDTGEFFYDPKIANDFVTISPDGGLTANANELGFVPTASAETITSQPQILNVPFLNWTVMSYSGKGAKPVIKDKSLKVDAHTTVVAFAFFGTENRHKPFLDFLGFFEATWHRLYPGEDVDAPRPHDPNPPQWKTVVKQLAVLLAMRESINSVSARLRPEIQTKIASSIKTLTTAINKPAR